MIYLFIANLAKNCIVLALFFSNTAPKNNKQEAMVMDKLDLWTSDGVEISMKARYPSLARTGGICL